MVYNFSILFHLYYREKWIEMIGTNQKDILSIKTVSNNKVWFEYLENKRDPAKSRYRCRLCYKYYDSMHLPSNRKPAVANKEGVLQNTKKKNQETISEHAKSVGHTNIISSLQAQSAKKQRNNFLMNEQKEENANDKYLEITSRMIRTVYVINKLSLPFSDHTALVMLQKLNGLNMGYHHYERTACTAMTIDISNAMHDTLIDSLIKSKMPISIIVDDTTDVKNVHFKIVYFQTIEVVNPVIYFYKLIELKSGTGLAGFEALQLSWQSEKRKEFYEYMQQNLIGFASDGAATNLGKYSGTAKYLKDWAKKPVFSIHCMSHRLELVIQQAFNKTDEQNSKVSEYLDKTINKVYTFYSTQGYKRVTHLKETCDRYNKKFYSLSKIIPIRWIASDYKAMKALNAMWDMIVDDLNEIAQDKLFTEKTRTKAKNLRPKLIGKNFLLLFHFLFDVVNQLSIFSLEMQKRTALIIDSNSFRNNFESIFERLKVQNGRYLELFLNEARCQEHEENDAERCNNVEKYLKSKKIVYKNIELENDVSNVPELIAYRTLLLDLLLAELKSYFPDGDLSNFDVFDPLNMPNPNDYASVRMYGIIKIKELNIFFKIGNEKAILDQWQALLDSIVSSPNYCQIKNSRTTVFAFWSQLLKWPEIIWGNEIKRLLFTVLSIPISSAEAERGFSALKYVRDSHRSRLTPTSLDAIMRIKLNGPDELDYFAASKYARNWVKNHFPTDHKSYGQKETTSHSLLEEENIELKKKYLLKSTIF